MVVIKVIGVNVVITVDGVELPSPAAQKLPSFTSQPQTPMELIAEWNRDPFSHAVQAQGAHGPQMDIATRPANTDTVGNSDTFVTANLTTGNPDLDVPAICRLITGPVLFADGRTRALNIWVDSK